MKDTVDIFDKIKESVKSLLIVLLLLSAGLLVWRIWSDAQPSRPPVSGQETAPSKLTYSPASYPSAVSLKSGDRRIAVQFDKDALQAFTSRMGEAAGETIGSAGPPKKISEQEWADALRKDGFYAVYPAPAPLTAVALWFNVEAPEHFYDVSCRSFIICRDGDLLSLYYTDDEGIRYSSAASAHNSTFYAASERVTGEDCILGCESDDPILNAVPGLLITDTATPNVITRTGFMDSEERRSELVRLFSINPYAENPYQEGSGAYVYPSAIGTIRISPDGHVLFRDNGERPAGLKVAGHVIPSREDIIETGRAIAAAAALLYCRDAESYFAGFEQTDTQSIVTFGLEVNGLPVTGVNDFLVLTVEDGYIVEAEMNITAFRTEEQTSYLFPIRQAAAMASADGANSLYLAYLPSGENEFSVSYVK